MSALRMSVRYQSDRLRSVRPHLRVAPLWAREDRLRTAQSEGYAAIAQGRQFEWPWPSHPGESICILLPFGSAGHSASADVSSRQKLEVFALKKGLSVARLFSTLRRCAPSRLITPPPRKSLMGSPRPACWKSRCIGSSSGEPTMWTEYCNGIWS
jgi:hypothetical protein